MPIHFQEDGGDYDVYAEEGPSGKLLGQIVQGRAMTNLSSNWTEWQFIPDDLRHETFPVRRSLAASREDARQYAQYLSLVPKK